MTIIINGHTIFAQSSYSLTIEREEETVPCCAVSTENNEVIASLNRLRFGEQSGISELIRIDANGKITDSLVFSSIPNRFYKIAQIGQSIHEGTYFGFGWQWTDVGTSYYLWIFEFDDSFNILWENIIDTLDHAPALAQLRHWNNHFFMGILIVRNSTSSTSYVYKTTEYGELLNKVSVPRPGEAFTSSSTEVYYLRQIPKTSFFLMNRGSFDSYCAVMDDDLNYIYSIYSNNYPPQKQLLLSPLDLEFFNDTEFILSGVTRKIESDNRKVLAVKKKDTSSNNDFKIRKFGYEGWEIGPFGCYAAGYKNLAMHSDYFFTGGWAFSSSNLYPDYDNFIMLYAFNYDLDSLWATNIGNDAYYALFYISPSPDGGCVLAASRYDWRKGDQKRNALIIKLPKPDITSISESEKPKPFASVYPNPGDNLFLVQTELTLFTLQLYDLQGQLLLTQQNLTEVNTEKLPSGYYIYRIIADDGRATNGKWVKK